MLGNRTLGDFLKLQDLCLKPALADSLTSSLANIVFLGLSAFTLSFVQSFDCAFSRAAEIANEPSLTRLI
jgi:hypothetical protein